MKLRMSIVVATVITLTQASAFFRPAASQTSRSTTKMRLVPVNARTITTLPNGKMYVLDLTKRGVKYEFDPKAGQIDLSRVVVRTAKDEVAIVKFLEDNFKGKLASAQFTSQAFTLGTRPPLTPRPPNRPNTILKCEGQVCTCSGTLDCYDLIGYSNLCGGPVVFCATDPVSGELVCSCSRF
jgi:hypothetical protein